MALLTAEHIYKSYDAISGKVHALNGIDLQLEKGLFYVITGKSGSGKSTLLHVLSGLDRPTKGRVILDGNDIYSYSDEKMAAFRRQYMGFVFQQYNLLEEYDVKHNICMPLFLDGKKVDMNYLMNIAEYLEIGDKMKKYPAELSGGEQQRVAIARSLIAKPQIIFADEPTGNLDKHTGEKIMHFLKKCVKMSGQTLIMVTHDLEIAEQADEVICLEDGRIKL